MQRVRDALNRIAACEKHTGHLFPQNGVIREARAALAALDEIEAEQPQWTSEPPTEEGWYCLCDSEGGLTLSKVDQHLEVSYDDYEESAHVRFLTDYYWFGPIPEPPTREETPQ